MSRRTVSQSRKSIDGWYETPAHSANPSFRAPHGQESRSTGQRAVPRMTAMAITIHASFLPHDDPDALAAG